MSGMNLTLKIWRQPGPKARGEMVTYPVTDISPDMSFLEMLDVLNEQLIARGEEPIAFDSDCREGICGMCGLMISGKAHGPEVTTTCQLHMRSFSDGDEITIEPWRADAFPVIKDLVVDRDSFDRIIQAGGFISANTGSAPEAHSVPVPKTNAPSTVAAPHMSYFISSMPAPGFNEMPPLSKVMPLPTNTYGLSPVWPPR